MSGPAIVLVEPSLPENVGAAARGMANFGMDDLRIVAPRCALDDGRALATATHGGSVLTHARLYETLVDAIADRKEVWATSAMHREFRKATHGPRQAAARLKEDSAVIFGPERTGLTSEHLTLAHALLTFPTSNDARALNLGTAVALVAWEWRAAQQGPDIAAMKPEEGQATMAEQVRFQTELEGLLERAGWASEPGLHGRTVRSLRALLLRARLRTPELTLLRSVFRALSRP